MGYLAWITASYYLKEGIRIEDSRAVPMKCLVKHTVMSLAALVVVLCEVEQAEAVPAYNFTQIAASSNGFNSLPSINAGGTVAFVDSTGNFVMVGNGGPVTVLYDTMGTGPFSGFGDQGPAINASG